MNIERRQKYANQGRTAVKTSNKININFDINVLNLFCSYVLSENRNIRRGNLINMRNLFEVIDINVYINDAEKMKRIQFINKALEGRLLHNIKNSVILLNYINGGILDDNLLDVDNFTVLSNDELDWINQTVSESLNYTFIYNDIDRMIDICTRFKASEYKSRGAIVSEFETLINEVQTKFRRVRSESLSEMPFTLQHGLFEEVIADIHEKLTNPSNLLFTGMQGFNELLGGGFFSSRVYMLLGMTGGGKSLTLLNLAVQMKKFNKNYKPKDPTKKPVILYMTMENTVAETVERLFTISTGKDIKDYSAEQVVNMLRTEGELYLTDDSPIDIIIKFVPDRSVDTGYLYTMVEDLEDEGYEVICLIQDHVKRIRSCYKYPDLRLELGGIVNEFKTFAALKEIPVITNSHLNRDGAKTIDEGSKCNKADLTRMLGRANIGESMLMLDNLDCSFIINMEYDAQGNKYMVFKRIKIRYKASERDYICQPFVKDNPIKLIEDAYCQIPAFKETLKPSAGEIELYNNGISPSKYQNDIKNIDEILNNNNSNRKMTDDNIFANSNRYSMNSTTINLNEYEEQQPIQHNIPYTCGIREDLQQNLKIVIERV